MRVGRAPSVRAWAAVPYAIAVIAAAAALAPIQDETYYWTWARALAWRYVDHPPGVAFVLAASDRLFGPGLLALRVPAVLAIVATALFVGLAVHRLARTAVRARAEQLALVVLAGAPMFAIGYLPSTPDPFQGAATALATWLLVRALEPGARDVWGGAAAFVLVASVLTKHSSGVLALGALAGALSSAHARHVLCRPAVWAGVLLGLVVVAPWLAADLGSASGSVHFQTSRVFTRGSARGLLAIPVLFGGLVVALGPAGVLALGRLATVRRLEREVQDSLHLDATLRVTGSAALLLLLSCLVPVWLGGGELNWSMPALVIALPAAAVMTVELGGRFERATRAAASVSAVLVFALLVHVVHPFLPISARKDTTQRGAGFEALANAAKESADRVGARVIVTRRYQAASELRYHLADGRPVLELGGSRFSQYDVWPRPPLCAGDVALVALNTEVMPKELGEVTALGAPELFERRARGEVIERWWLTPVRVTADAFGPDVRCGHVVATEQGGAP